MSRLDSEPARTAGDPSGTLAAVASIPQQVRDAVAADAHVALGSAPRHVVFCGMGGSGVGGEAIAAAAARTGRVPVTVHRDYGAPAYCGPDTLVVASSYSGETAETLDAFRAARDMGAAGIAVTSGGTLQRQARSAGWPVLEVPADLPKPRYALGWMTVAPALALTRAGLLGLQNPWPAPADLEVLDACVRRWGPAAPTADNVAKALAHEMAGAVCVVWGGGGVSAAAASRFKADLNENAKVFAHAACLPEADHNEIVGLAQEGRTGRPIGRKVLVCLRERGEDPRVTARFDATKREVAGDFVLVWEYTAEAGDPIVQFLELSILAGFVSVYLAILRGVDPAPILSIDRLKAALAGS